MKRRSRQLMDAVSIIEGHYGISGFHTHAEIAVIVAEKTGKEMPKCKTQIENELLELAESLIKPSNAIRKADK